MGLEELNFEHADLLRDRLPLAAQNGHRLNPRFGHFICAEIFYAGGDSVI